MALNPDIKGFITHKGEPPGQVQYGITQTADGDKNPLKRNHPAVFLDKIPHDIISVFCPEGGLVLDVRSDGAVRDQQLFQAVKTGRRFLGIDIEPEYINIVKERLHKECAIHSDIHV